MNYFPVKPGNQLIYDMINDRFGTSYTLGQLTLGPPTPTVSEGRNTEVTVGVTTGPLVNQITKALYNRLNLSILFENYDKNIVDSGSFTNVSDVLSYIQSNFNVLIQPSDIVDTTIGTGPYPRTFAIQAAVGSYSYVGSVNFNLTEGASVGPAWTTDHSANENLAFTFGDGTFLAMTPEGDSVPGGYMYLVEFVNVGGNWGRYLAGFRFTPLPADNIQPSDDNSIYIQLPESSSLWALDVVVANDQRPTPEPFSAEEMPFGGGPFELRMTVQVDSMPPVIYAAQAAGATFRWRIVDGFGYADVSHVDVEDISGGRQAVIGAQARFTESFIASQVVGESTTVDGVLIGDISVSFSIFDPANNSTLVEMTQPFVATIEATDYGGGGEGGGPNSWTMSKFLRGWFGDGAPHGTGGDLFMTPNGETVDGDNFAVIEQIDERNVAQPYGCYRTGIRFSTTPVPETPIAALDGPDADPRFYIQLPTDATPWAVDVVVAHDFGLTNTDPFNGPLNGFEYSIGINPDGLGLFIVRAVPVNDAGTMRVELRDINTNALVKMADYVMVGGVGTPQEGNVIGFQVRFDHALLLAQFPAVEKTASDIPYGNWFCRIAFYEPGTFNVPAMSIPFGDVNAVISLP